MVFVFYTKKFCVLCAKQQWEIEDYVVKTQGMRTMREELADLVCAGVISMEEFLRTVETW